MRQILLDCGQAGGYILQVPDRIAGTMWDYQMQFDQWLCDPASNHGHWVELDGERVLCYDPPEVFTHWLNTHVLTGPEQAELIARDLPVLRF